MSYQSLFGSESIPWFPRLDEETKRASSQISIPDWEAWLKANFPLVVNKPFGERHIRLWRWFASLEPGVRPRPRVEPWPRGSAKSATGELGVVYVGSKLARRYVLYVSGTQEQANEHLQAIANYFEEIGIERAITKYGHSKGWTQQQLNTSHGFHVRALGLDVAGRGLKKDHYRPDLIIFDDIDSEDDSPKTVEKKEKAIRAKIMGAGSDDVAFLFLQNLIHEDSVICRLLDGVSEWLLDREVAPIEPAVRGMEVERYIAESGQRLWRIVAGEPTWEGQGLATCEQQINSLGIDTFRREMQHEVRGAAGYFFDENAFEEIDWKDVPRLLRVVLSMDFAATEGGGDYTVFTAMGIAPNGRIIVLFTVRKQLGTDNVRRLLKELAVIVRDRFGPKVKIVIPRDPGSAGKNDIHTLRKLLTERDPNDKDFKPFDSAAIVIMPADKKKAIRAKELQTKVNSGNVALVRPVQEDRAWLPLLALDEGGLVPDWIRAFKREHGRFREDELHDYDDQVDAAGDGARVLAREDGWAAPPPPNPAATARPIQTYRPR